eukprot:TRINITY_DN6609_c0_g1_i2.p1 TRINITY_DN6609_c0_g1~~TRINITY_DN6609_c0_g1_i2.p1  ORF type:complete len:432 (-),score=94.30 TRINITY_DN6609_c0_g1_i2:490-1785(-)
MEQFVLPSNSTNFERASAQVTAHFEAIDEELSVLFEEAMGRLEAKQEKLMSKVSGWKGSAVKRLSPSEATSDLQRKEFDFISRKFKDPRVRLSSSSNIHLLLSINRVFCGISPLPIHSIVSRIVKPRVVLPRELVFVKDEPTDLSSTCISDRCFPITREVETITSEVLSTKMRAARAVRGIYGIAVHPHSQEVYVAEYNNQAISVYDKDLEYIRTFWSDAESDESTGGLTTPRGIAISWDGCWVAAAFAVGGVAVFDIHGTVHHRIDEGSDADQVRSPRFVCFDYACNILVACGGMNMVKRFGLTGELINVYQETAPGLPSLSNPSGVAINDDGEVMILEYAGNRICFFSLEGSFLRQFSINKMSNFSHVTRGPNGTVLVSDGADYSIKLYSPTGELIFRKSSPAAMSAEFGADGSLYVGCWGSENRIQKW